MTTYRTPGGRVLTDADIERLADEAERGYDVERRLKAQPKAEYQRLREQVRDVLRRHKPKS